MYYEYKEWGNTIAVILLNNTDEERELANANPLRYRGYYFDTETGYYYLQSRYYDSSICRFINADVADIAYECREELIGTNLFAYCCNNPINCVDHDGYWGEAVHNGYNPNTYTKYNNVKVNNKTYFYGTYYWAIQCGFSASAAKKLGSFCNDLDKYYSSTKYTDALYTNNYYIRNGHKALYSKKQLDNFKHWQYYHFNGYAKGGGDTRKVYSINQRNIAVQKWRSDRNYALKMLGYGLHAIQDISAHGQIGRGAEIPQHIFPEPKNKSLFKQADTVQGYVWTNSSRNGLKYSKGNVSRLMEAQRDTYTYLNDFVRSIGGKKKLK